jgi:hypothetical protein
MSSTNPPYSSAVDGHSQRNTEIVVLVIFFAVCCCYITIFFLCNNHNQEESPQQQSPDTTGARRQRIDLIREALIVKPWTEAMSATVAINETATEETRDTGLPKTLVPSPKLKSQHSSITSLHGPCCAICLDGFKEGQLVCESKNGSCEHSFHEMCLIKWLLLKGHNDCPICRAKYLVEMA